MTPQFTPTMTGLATPEPLKFAFTAKPGAYEEGAAKAASLASAMLIGRLDDESRSNARVAVLKALGGNSAMPFIALLAQGFPRLTTITRVSGSSATRIYRTSSKSAIVRVWGTTTSIVGTKGQLPRTEMTPRDGV